MVFKQGPNNSLKELFTQNLKFTHPQAIQDVWVYFFTGTDLEKFSITSLAQ